MSSDFEQKTIDLIISLIRTRYNKKNADFAKLCGLTVPALSRFVNKQHTNIGLHTFLKMCVLLDIKIIEDGDEDGDEEL